MRILYNLRDKYFEPYSQILYSKLQNAKLDEKAQYVKQLKEYRNRIFDINNIPSRKNTNMLDYLKSEYDVENNNIVLIKDINKKRKDSYEILSKEFSEYNDILEQLFSDDHFESLLRFGELSPIRQEMLLLIEKTKIAKEKSDKQTGDNPVSISTGEPVKQQPDRKKEIHHNDPTIVPRTVGPTGITLKTTHHFKYQPIIKKDGISIEFVPFDEVKKKTQVNNTTDSNQPAKHMTSYTKKEIEKRAKEAEKIALSELEKHGYTNIKWVSSFAKDEGKHLDGSDGYGYDILCEKDSNVRYVEVKSSIYSSGIEFEMTENELSTCSKNKDNYDIAYIYGMNSESPKLTIIENVFYAINDSNKTPASYKITLK